MTTTPRANLANPDSCHGLSRTNDAWTSADYTVGVGRMNRPSAWEGNMTKTITAADIRNLDADGWADIFGGDTVNFAPMTDSALREVARIATANGDRDLAEMALDEMVGRDLDVSDWRDEE